MTWTERKQNLERQLAQLAAVEANIAAQLADVKTQRARVEGALQLLEELIRENGPNPPTTSAPAAETPPEPAAK